MKAIAQPKETELFSCSDCSKAYISRRDLNRHRNRHVRPHRCSICSKGFALKADLERHNKTHQRTVRTFGCPFSGCTSHGETRKDHVLRHLRRTHKLQGQPLQEMARRIHRHKIEEEAEARLDMAMLQAAGRGEPESLRQLISQGVRVTATTRDWETPLHVASMAGDACIAQLLLDNGAEFGAEDLSGDSPLHTATKYGHLAVAQLLLDNGADISTTNNLHRTSLHIAAENGHLAVAELLLCRGARIQATDCGARTPLYLAACNGHRSTVELLVGREADANPANVRLHVTAIRVAFINGHHQIVRSLLSAVMKTNSLDADVAEALHQAARLGRVRVVELIFGPGAAMSAVTGLGPTRVVERLLEKGPVNSWRDNTTRDWNPRELVERAQWIAILCDQKTVAESGCE